MRTIELAASAALLCIGLAGAAQAQVVCPLSKSGPPSVDTVFYTDAMMSAGSSLKPTPFPYQKGLCIDSAGASSGHRAHHHHHYAGGDIHLYLADAAYDWISFTIDPTLGKYDANDPDDAFKAPGQHFCASNAVKPDGSQLQICLTSMGHNKYFPYYMRYLDPGGTKHKVEPGTQNH
jgi:hypothetical protein